MTMKSDQEPAIMAVIDEVMRLRAAKGAAATAVEHSAVGSSRSNGVVERAIQTVQGMVFRRQAESNIIKKENCKVAIFTCPVDALQTETKGTVLIKTAEELTNFSRGEETQLENQIKAIAESGAEVIVAGGKIGDLAVHYINKYNMMAVRLMSKWDIRRLARATGATALPKMTPPTAEELGRADSVYVDELGDTEVVVFKVGNKRKSG